MRRQKARQQAETGREFRRRSASSMATLSPEVLDKLAKDDPAMFVQLAGQAGAERLRHQRHAQDL
jgi:hypothetical protein